jgi:ankyrin repeat/BTB/POZ domain-containing protein 1
MMDETAALPEDGSTADVKPDEAIDVAPIKEDKEELPDPTFNGQIRTLDGEIVTDEFAADAINYQVLLGKLDKLLERLKLDA